MGDQRGPAPRFARSRVPRQEASRALVLGGGGVTGMAWMTGVLEGLRAAGFDARSWDLVVGTSAGSVVGARLLADPGFDDWFASQVNCEPTDDDLLVRALAGRVGALALTLGRRRPFGWLPQMWMSAFALETLVRHAARRRLHRTMPVAEPNGGARVVAGPDPALARIGALALAARTAMPQRYCEIVCGILGDAREWPEPLVVTAIDAVDGSTVALGPSSGVALELAVSASAAVPILFPPVVIAGRPYIDGGLTSQTHAQLAASHDEVLILAPIDLGRLSSEVATLEAAGSRVEVVTPSPAALVAIGRNVALLDPARRSRAADEGFADGVRAAGRFEQARPAAAGDSAA